MDIKLSDGVYVLAISGGIDSMSLLHALMQFRGSNKRLRFVVAHCDHGIRPESDRDRRFVQSKAAEYGLPFVHRRYALGAYASEASARKIRYELLHDVRRATKARAIITAHHRQDVLETAIINILRGTGRKGLSSLGDGRYVIRPLLGATKEDIVQYAKSHNIDWVNDSTNEDMKYTRNYIRHSVLPKFTASEQAQFSAYLTKAKEINQKIDAHLTTIIHCQPRHEQLDRSHIAQLPFQVSVELIAAWLRHHDCRGFDAKSLHRLTVACRTAAHGTAHAVSAGIEVYMHPNYYAILRKV